MSNRKTIPDMILDGFNKPLQSSQKNDYLPTWKDTISRFQASAPGRNIYTDKGEEDDIYMGDVDKIEEFQIFKDFPNNEIEKLSKSEKARYFIERSKIILEVCKKGKINKQTAAYMIAGWLSDKDLMSIPQIYEIVMLANGLELPYYIEFSKLEYKFKWFEFKILIKSLPWKLRL